MASRFLAGLGQGLSTFADLQTKANRYKDEQARLADERDRQIARDALYKTLVESQMANATADNERADEQLRQTAKANQTRTVMDRIKLQRDEQDQQMARSNPPPAPQRNIDPLSAEGIAARLRLEKGLEGLKPNGGGPGAKPLTEAQAKATGYYGRARDAEAVLKNLPSRSFGGAAVGMAQNVKNIPYIGDAIGGVVTPLTNPLLDPAQQKFENAADAFLAAVLRQESGAAISATERSEYRKIYIPEYGDSKEVLAQKAANRATAIEALRTGAGPGVLKNQTPTTKADRWEELVDQGMTAEQATAKVNQEFPE